MKKLLYILLFFFGISCLIGSYAVYQNTHQFLAVAKKVEGTVGEMVQTENKKFAPKIFFHTPTDEEITFVSDKATRKPAYEIGERVMVLYEPDHPHNAHIDTVFSQSVELTLFIVGGIVSTIYAIFKLQKKPRFMKSVRIYTIPNCPYCERSKKLFQSLGIPYEEIDVASNDALREELVEKYNWKSVPMIFIDDKFIGGSDDLFTLHREGKLVKNEESHGAEIQ